MPTPPKSPLAKYSIPASVEILADEPAQAPVSAPDLIGEINRLHRSATEDASHAKVLAQSATRSAILAGLRLIQLKDATPHGGWEALFQSGMKRVGKSNVNHGCHLEFSFETARKYIAVTTQLINQKLLPEQSAAIMAIGADADPTPEELSLLDELTPAKSLRQLYLEFGIIKPTKQEQRLMDAAASEATHAKPEPKQPLTLAARLERDRARARETWFGTAKPGRIDPGSILAIVQMELDHPAEGTVRLLAKSDAELMAADFRRFAKALAAHAAEL